jgi:hypothetical protein
MNLLNYTGDYSSAASVSCGNSTLLTRGGAQPEILQKESVLPNEEPVSVAFDVVAMPNPSTSTFRLNLKGSGTGPVVIRIFDMTGRVIEQYQKSANTLMEIGSAWRGGTYMVEVVQDGKRKVIKLVKVS